MENKQQNAKPKTTAKPKKVEVPAEATMTVSEIVEHPYFIEELKRLLEKINHDYQTRQAPPGFRFARTGMDTIREEGKFHIYFFKDNIMDIWQKKSQLSSAVRKSVVLVGNAAFSATIYRLSKERTPVTETPQKTKKTTQKRSTPKKQ